MDRRVRRRNSILEAIEQLRKTEPRINVTEMVVFFYVAENPGINIAELAQVAGLNMATASRSIRALAGPEDEGALPPHVVSLNAPVTRVMPRALIESAIAAIAFAALP